MRRVLTPLRLASAAAFLLLPLQSLKAQLAGRYYWHEDSSLRADPAKDAALKTWVPSGAYVDIQSCDEEGWCFGRAFGVSEGWVPLKELHRSPPILSSQSGILESATLAERVYHLQDHRKFYGVLGNDFLAGKSSLENVNEDKISRVQSWALFVGAGRKLKTFDVYRWDLEFGLGHLSEWRESPDLGETSRVNSNNFYVLVGTKLLRPENEYFGFGGFVDLKLRFGAPGLEDGLNKNLAPFLVSVGPLISHGIGSSRLKWVSWKMSVSFSSAEAFAGLGLNLNF